MCTTHLRFSLVWSMGAALVEEDRPKLDLFIKKVALVSLPGEILYNYMYDVEQHKWVPWADLVPEYVQPAPFRYSEIMVPTTDSVSQSVLYMEGVVHYSSEVVVTNTMVYMRLCSRTHTKPGYVQVCAQTHGSNEANSVHWGVRHC